jgi:hypothetical protein
MPSSDLLLCTTDVTTTTDGSSYYQQLIGGRSADAAAATAALHCKSQVVATQPAADERMEVFMDDDDDPFWDLNDDDKKLVAGTSSEVVAIIHEVHTADDYAAEMKHSAHRSAEHHLFVRGSGSGGGGGSRSGRKSFKELTSVNSSKGSGNNTHHDVGFVRQGATTYSGCNSGIIGISSSNSNKKQLQMKPLMQVMTEAGVADGGSMMSGATSSSQSSYYSTSGTVAHNVMCISQQQLGSSMSLHQWQDGDDVNK